MPGPFTLLHQAVLGPRFYTFTVSSGPHFYTALIFRWRATRALGGDEACDEGRRLGPDGAIKVEELKEELEARGEGKSGNKAWLRRRLHAAIVSEYLESGDE